ncbi:MAG: HNH endonuclease [Methylobacter sp.]
MTDEEFIKNYFSYDPITGNVTWIKNYRNKKEGEVVSSISTNGYLRVGANKKRFQLHKVAWFLHYGSWPINEIDHINRVRNDNRICNLRDVAHSINTKNMSNSKGYRVLSSGNFEARIIVDGKYISLGTYKTEQEASRAYSEARKIYHNGVYSECHQ